MSVSLSKHESSQSAVMPDIKDSGNTAHKEGKDFSPYCLLTQSLLEPSPGCSPGASPAQKDGVKFLIMATAAGYSRNS